MIVRNTFLAMVLVASSSALALGQVKLERKFQEGTIHAVDVTTKTEQKLTIAGMDIDTDSDSRTTVKVTVAKRDEAGAVRVQEKIESLMITTKVMGTEYVFDSANPDKASGSALEMLRPVHKAMVRRTATTVYDKNNKITQVEFDQDVLNDLTDDVRKLVKGQFDPEAIKKAANEEIEKLPLDPVKKGDTWERTTRMNLGAGQVMTVATRYTYDGEIEKNGRKLEKVVSKVRSTDFALEDSPLPFTVKSSELKPAESKGEFLFDRVLGQVIESSSMVQIVGDMTFVINNQELPVKLDLKMETSTQRKD